jgi:flagellar biosynthesis/type III secretory pathway protein FliH
MISSDRAASKDNFLIGENSEEFVPTDFSTGQDTSLESFRVWDPKGSANSSDDDDRDEESQNPSLKPNQNSVLQKTIKADNSKLEEEYERGFKEGKAASAEEMEKKSRELSSLLEILKSGQCDVMEYYSPLKTLAVRITEAILKVELVESRESIAKIVKDLLDEAAPYSESPATLYLSQDDFNTLSPEFISQYEDVRMVIDGKLSRGSAYAEMNDRLITDLEGDRIDAVVQKVIQHG